MENNVSGLPPLAVNAACHSAYPPGFVCQAYPEDTDGVEGTRIGGGGKTKLGGGGGKLIGGG